MSIDKTECCNMHTKEKEDNGTCCQTKSIHQLCVENPTLTYRQVERLKEPNYESSQWYLGKHNNEIGSMRQKQRSQNE